MNARIPKITNQRNGSLSKVESPVSGLKVAIGETFLTFSKGKSANNTDTNNPVTIPKPIESQEIPKDTSTGRKSAKTAGKTN